MQSSRLLALLLILQIRGRQTAQALAQEFETSKRTIYRDMDRLSAAGIPVYADKGPGGGFELLEGYRTKLTGLDLQEAAALFLIGRPEIAQAIGIGAESKGATSKLLAALGQNNMLEALKQRDFIHVDPSQWYHANPAPEQLPLLYRAIVQQRRIKALYTSWLKQAEWMLEPLGLVMKADVWYVVANGLSKTRTFRVSNFIQVEMVGERFERPCNFSIASFWQKHIIHFENDLRPQICIIHATPEGCRRLRELGTFGEEAIKKARPSKKEGWLELDVRYENLDQASRMFLGLGTEIEVIEPKELRNEIASLLATIGHKYCAKS